MIYLKDPSSDFPQVENNNVKIKITHDLPERPIFWFPTPHPPNEKKPSKIKMKHTLWWLLEQPLQSNNNNS